MLAETEPPRIAGPLARPKRPRVALPPGAWDAHFHIFGPSDRFPYQPGRGYTPPDAPVEMLIALLDHLGFERGLVVQGNAHVYDNRVVLDALARFPQRLRGIAITDLRLPPGRLRDWHERGMRGLRFHLFAQRPITDAGSVSTYSKCFARPWPISAGLRNSSAITGCSRRPRKSCARFHAICRSLLIILAWYPPRQVSPIRIFRRC